MAAGLGAIIGLLIGVLLAFAGGEALTRGSKALLAGMAGVAAFAAVLCSAVPEYAFAIRAASLNLPGAAVGAVAGSFIVNALVAAMVASSGSNGTAPGAKSFAILSAVAAVVLIAVAFDGRISRTEGQFMLAGAVFVAWRAARLGGESPPSPERWRPLPGLGWIAFGIALTVGGAWLTLQQVSKIAGGRQGPDMTVGLVVLGLGAALPETLAAVMATRRGEGAQAFVNVATGATLTLFGALGAAAMVRPIVIYESFVGVPALALVVGALTLVVLAVTGARAPKAGVAVGVLVYLGFLAAFLRNGL